jgi:hypothetical protein
MQAVGIDQCKAVHLRADGYDVYPLHVDLGVYKAFLSILAVAKLKDSMKDWVGPVETYTPAVAA